MVVTSRRETGCDRLRHRTRADPHLRARNKPQADKDQCDRRHRDGDGAVVEEAKEQIAEPDADHEPWQEHEVRLRPRRGLPVAQREQIHRDKQGREQTAGGDRVHHDR
jgi:hypothetical protein